MTTPIKTRIVKIDNSQGLRIPKTLLEQSGIKSEVEVRKGWEKAFIEMAEKGDDVLLDEINTTEWDAVKW